MIDQIQRNIDDKRAGIVKAIPCSLDRFSSVWSGIIKGDYVCFTGSTSSGKTTLAKKLALFDSIEYAIATGLDLKILYFGLEESEEQLHYTILSYLLKKNFGIRLNIIDFLCIKREVSSEHLGYIKQVQDELNLYISYIIYYDVHNPFGIYKTIREFAFNRGKFVDADGNVLSSIDGEQWSYYVPDNPNEFIITMIDHVGLLLPETKHQNKLDLAMQDLSFYLRAYVTKKFSYTVVAIHQQMAETEDLDHIKNRRWMPTLQGLATNKRLGQDYLTVISIGNPIRYNIAAVEGYEVKRFRGFLRFVEILKQRYGMVPPMMLPIYMDGKCNWIKTAPLPHETTKLLEHVETIYSEDFT